MSTDLDITLLRIANTMLNAHGFWKDGDHGWRHDDGRQIYLGDHTLGYFTRRMISSQVQDLVDAADSGPEKL